MTLKTFQATFPQGRQDIPTPASFSSNQRAAVMLLNGAEFADVHCVGIAMLITDSETGLLVTLPNAVADYMTALRKQLRNKRIMMDLMEEDIRVIGLDIEIVEGVLKQMSC